MGGSKRETQAVHNAPVVVFCPDADLEWQARQAASVVAKHSSLLWFSQSRDLERYVAEQFRPPAYVLLIDKPLPQTGYTLVHHLRHRPQGHRLPVIVLAPTPDAVRQAYVDGANCALLRPQTDEQLGDILADLHVFWTEIAQQPGRVYS